MSIQKQTPKGKAEQIFWIEDDKGNPIKVMNWHGYPVEVGANKSPFFFNLIQNRRINNKSNIILLTGSPGDGKTYCAIKLAEIFDPYFDPDLQIIFTRPQLLNIIGEKSPLKRGQVIVVDEAHYGLGSRRWMESVQKDLMDALASVRSRGFIIMIVSLHIDMLDKIVRKYVLSFMVHLEERGKGVVYRLYTPRFASELYKMRLGTIYLPLPDAEICEHPSCLACKHRGICQTTRAIYERNKKKFVDEASKQAEARAKEREQKDIRINKEKVVQELLAEGEKVELNLRGRVDKSWLYIFIEKRYGIKVGNDLLRLISGLYNLEPTRKIKKHP